MRVLEKMYRTVQDREMLYKVVLHNVLLYRSESWMIMGELMKVMEAFHHRIARRIIGKKVWRVREEG